MDFIDVLSFILMGFISKNILYKCSWCLIQFVFIQAKKLASLCTKRVLRWLTKHPASLTECGYTWLCILINESKHASKQEMMLTCIFRWTLGLLESLPALYNACKCTGLTVAWNDIQKTRDCSFFVTVLQKFYYGTKIQNSTYFCHL